MNVGDKAPDFTLQTDDGRSLTLSEELARGPVVLFFYPKAMTSGCTKESCHFRDLGAEFTAAGGQRLGISLDTVAKQHQFSQKHGFDYPLLSDPGGAVAKQFGVKRVLPFTKRATFVIDTDRTVIGVIASEFDTDKHADDALALLKARAAGAAS
ncbi:MAG TPA: peroxiredoxin [Acidimicrobiales bacterium]|jgi:peroxiredoxin Q/BCP|nr:peroxiredoxin [Acidimicrobiales bacterium]